MGQTISLDSPEHIHWADKFLFARDKMNEYKTLMAEAKEVLLGLFGEDWDVVKVNGKPVFENVRTSPNRFSVTELKKKYPDIYAELTKPVPQSSMKVLGE